MMNYYHPICQMTDKRFDNIVSEIQNNHDFIQNVTQETAKFITEFEKVSAKLSSLSLKQMNDSSEINKYLEEITIGVHELLKGKLSPFLIPPHVLKHTISQIQIILNDKFKGFYLTHTDPTHYYSNANMLYTRQHSHFFNRYAILPKKVDQCQNNSDSVTILHPVNLALIKSFFSSETYNSIMGVTTFTNPAVLNLPNLNFYNHSFSQFIAQDQQLHFSLKRIAQATKKDKVIFKSLSESMLDGQISAIESWPDFNGIISLVALGLSIIMTVAYVLLFNKVRALTTALILLQKSPSISAFVTPITPPTFNFVRNVQSTTSETYKVDFISQLGQWPSLVLTSLTIISFCVAIHYIYTQCRSQPHTQVILEVSNGLHCVVIPILNLPLCPSDWEISAPSNIGNLRVSGTFITRFHVDWSGFYIVNINTKQEILIPDTIPINPIKARILKSVISTTFTSYILIAHHKYFKIV
ncbi:unnamed protein product [Mytilus coruscus]|uniref:Uncharacterized protein n=1 Tax=Mytilus coruscus TaxID=42192 RepID=A0A6J8CWH3_MYTCO|nr:unnamed protein product [Mytilus coruscus]